MVAPAFTLVGGGEKPIKDIFADNSVFQAAETDADADLIKVWKDTTYVTYFYASDAGNAWSSDQDGFDETTDTIPIGNAFWLYRVGTAVPTATLCGEVIGTDIDVAIFGGTGSGEDLTQVGNPFSHPLPIASITAPDLQAAETDADADLIKVWNGSTYLTYFYASDAGDAWSSDQDGFDETTDTIPIGGAFWFVRRGTPTTITLPVPYTL